MKRFGAILLLAALVGCDGSQSSVVLAATEQPVATGWMTPEAKSDDLLYVSAGQDIYAFSYPAGKLVGTLTGFYQSAGLCTDKAGDVFVPNQLGVAILEFAHGGTKPIALLWDYGQEPVACAVDPVTGDLAVMDSNTADGGAGSVAIYHKARGWPRYVEGKGDLYWFCSYDNAGNLFYDYQDLYHKFHLMELFKGSRKAKEIALHANVPLLGAIQWDGSHITIGEDNAATIYRLAISGSQAKIVGTSKFGGTDSPRFVQYWIQGSTVVMPFSRFDHAIGFWRYPAGGKHFKVIPPFGSDVLFGTTISAAPNSK